MPGRFRKFLLLIFLIHLMNAAGLLKMALPVEIGRMWDQLL